MAQHARPHASAAKQNPSRPPPFAATVAAMFFWPKKILTLFFLPLHFALFAGIAGLILLHLRRRERLARVLVTAAIVALALFSNNGVSHLLIAPLESHYPAAPEIINVSTAAARAPDTLASTDAASSSARPMPPALATCRHLAILGGGHGETPGLSRINQLSTASLGRLAEGIRIFRQLPPDALFIVSGHAGEGNTSHAQIMAEAAASLGVPPDRIRRLDTPRDTHDEALALRSLAGDAPVALVTSAWHLPRAMRLCEGAGLRVIPCPSSFMLKPAAGARLEMLRFDLGSLERSTKAIHEHLGLLWSALRGQL